MNGQGHRRLNLIVAPGIIGGSAAITYYLSESTRTMMGIEAAIIAAFIFQYAANPDLDLLENSIGAKLNRRWVPAWWYAGRGRLIIWSLLRLFYWFGLVYMWPYAKLIPHRHLLSHMPLLGTALRLCYILWPLVFVHQWLIANIGIAPMISFVVVVAILDITHWLADGMPMHQTRS